LTLRESFDVQMTEQNVQLAICTSDGYSLLSAETVKDHIQAL